MVCLLDGGGGARSTLATCPSVCPTARGAAFTEPENQPQATWSWTPSLLQGRGLSVGRKSGFWSSLLPTVLWPQSGLRTLGATSHSH